MIGISFNTPNKPLELIGQEIMRCAQSVIIVDKMQYCACIFSSKPNAVLEWDDVVLESVNDFNIHGPGAI